MNSVCLNIPGALTYISLLPLVGMLVVSAIPNMYSRVQRALGMFFTLSTLLGHVLFFKCIGMFSVDTYHFKWIERVTMVSDLGFHYVVGIDGLNFWLVLATSLLSFMALLCSAYEKTKMKTLVNSILLLQLALIGAFISLDLLMFFICFELTLVPVFLLVSMWGGEEGSRAALKFFVYTFTGSIFMLAGIIVLGLMHRCATGILSFNYLDIQSVVANGALWKTNIQLEKWIFWSFAIAFMVKSPMVPFHTWMPRLYKYSPAGSMILSAVVLKLGSYGFLRFCLPLFPDVIAYHVPWMVSLCIASIVYGGFLAVSQRNIMGIMAYSSISHMGFVLLGIFSLSYNGMVGGTIQQLNHIISTGLIMMLLSMLFARKDSRKLSEYGGLKAQMPIFAALFLIAMLSSVGLPGTNGFIGEFLSLQGLFETGAAYAYGLEPFLAGVAGLGLIIAACYLLRLFQGIFYGDLSNLKDRYLRDIKPFEFYAAGVMVIIIFLIGFNPSIVTKTIEPSIGAVREMVIRPAGERPTWKRCEWEEWHKMCNGCNKREVRGDN